MKITVVSDLHLEFGDLDLRNIQSADVLVLSGDIVIGADLNHPEVSTYYEKTKMMRGFVQRCKAEFPHVVAVAGNHEFYHSRYDKALVEISEMYQEYGVHFLDASKVMIDDVMFIGGTLWSDFNKADALTLHTTQAMMNDFVIIKWEDKINNVYRKFKPQDALNIHNHTKQYLINEFSNLNAEQKVVVVSHHAPTHSSTHPRYREDHLVNGAYRSDLSDLILDNPQIKLWTHGHTHNSFDYMVGTTRVVCNPRGYARYDENEYFDRNKTVEI